MPIIISFLGVDGSGKTTLIKKLHKELNKKFSKIRYFHLRPYFILLNKNTVNRQPHFSNSILPIYINFLRIIYWLIIYHIFFFFFKIKKNQLILFDRYVHDLLIDNKRYSFNPPNKIFKFILNLFPKPNLWVVLTAPVKLLEKRKKELSTRELKKQIKSYLNFAKKRQNSIVINTNNSVQSSLSLIIKKINNFD